MDKRIKEDWQGRRAAVIGLGISNFALIKFLKDVVLRSQHEIKNPRGTGRAFRGIKVLRC